MLVLKRSGTFFLAGSGGRDVDWVVGFLTPVLVRVLKISVRNHSKSMFFMGWVESPSKRGKINMRNLHIPFPHVSSTGGIDQQGLGMESAIDLCCDDCDDISSAILIKMGIGGRSWTQTERLEILTEYQYIYIYTHTPSSKLK